MHPVSRLLRGAQATCMEAGPGSENGAEAHGGILESWESRTEPSNNRRGMTPGSQRPGTGAVLSAALVSEYRRAAKDSVSEGNRSERGNGYGSLRGLTVALESRVTEPMEPVSSEGDLRGEIVPTGPTWGTLSPQQASSNRQWYLAQTDRVVVTLLL